MTSFNAYYRFGSAGWATEAEIAAAGLFKPKGVLLGYWGERQLRLESDAPMLTIGGAGSGKLRDLLGYTVCGCRTREGRWAAPLRLIAMDSRGELTAIALQNQVRLGKPAYSYNPVSLHGLPHHRVNPLDMLRRGAKTLHADAKWLAACIVSLSGSAQAEYFELRARQWIEALMLYAVARHGGITLAQLYDLIIAIEDPQQWPDIGESMLNAGLPEARRTAIEIETKRRDAEKEYGAIMGEIQKSLDFLSDPMIRNSVSVGDFSLEVLCLRDCSVSFLIPAEYATQLAPLNRLLFGAAMLYKFRVPAAPTVTFLVDEAATLGRFDALLQGYTYGRGMGVRMWSIWQDPGQIARNYGRDALSSFIGSSQVRQFFGVRDIETAKVISAMLGQETLNFDPYLHQEAAKRDMLLSARQMLAGGDPFEIGFRHRYQAITAVTPTQQARSLMTPDEILNLPEDRQILLISGLGLKPILANKYPYYTRPEMAGGYMPNPYHPPGDRVRVAGHPGGWARVITERVPAKYAILPQYQSGQWSFIAGYRPR